MMIKISQFYRYKIVYDQLAFFLFQPTPKLAETDTENKFQLRPNPKWKLVHITYFWQRGEIFA